MPDNKPPLIAPGGFTGSQSQNSGTARIGCMDIPSDPRVEENLRLIKAFGRVDDSLRRAWLLELVEHFAGLDAAAH